MSDSIFSKKEKELELAKLEDETAGVKASIAQRKALEREAKKTEGKDWKKVLGLVGKIKPDMETIHTLYSFNAPALREGTKPRFRR